MNFNTQVKLTRFTQTFKNASQVMCWAGNNYTESEYLKMNKFCNVWNSDKHLMKL